MVFDIVIHVLSVVVVVFYYEWTCYTFFFTICKGKYGFVWINYVA